MSKKVDWSKVPLGTKVLVSTFDGRINKEVRHFAGMGYDHSGLGLATKPITKFKGYNCTWDIMELAPEESTPKILSLWKHKNGNKYLVLLVTNKKSTRQEEYPTTIVYMNIKNFTIWSRRYIDWHRSMTQIW